MTWARIEKKLENGRKVWAKDRSRVQLYNTIEDALNCLATTCWLDNLTGFTDSDPLHILGTLGEPTKWLGTTHENLLLDLLREDVLTSEQRNNIEVENMDFLTKLATAHKSSNTSKFIDWIPTQ